MFKKINHETQFLTDLFVENRYKRIFPENLIKDYNAKKKKNNSCNYNKTKKILWVPKLD